LPITSNQRQLPPCLPAFEHIKRYRDPTRNQGLVAKLLPGEFYVTSLDEMITTVLGSCISVCICDLKNKVGGMNHFMLPSQNKVQDWDTTNVNEAARYGNFAMEKLINEILKNGGDRQSLMVKIFGGGKIMSDMADIGRRNIAFTKAFLEREGLKVSSMDVGDIFPRKINFYPTTGKVMVKRLNSLHNDTLITRERRYRSEIEHTPVAGDIELF